MAILTRDMLTPAVKARFWAAVDKRAADECWPWVGTYRRAYGRFYIAGKFFAATRRLPSPQQSARKEQAMQTEKSVDLEGLKATYAKATKLLRDIETFMLTHDFDMHQDCPDQSPDAMAGELDAAVPALIAEIERLRAAPAEAELRALVAKLYCASGCSCCRDDTAWYAAADELAKALNIPRFADDSGWDFWSVRDAAKEQTP